MQTAVQEETLYILPASMGHTCFSLETNSSLKWLICKLVQRAEKRGFQDLSIPSPICVLVSSLVLQKDSDQMQCNHTFWSLLHWHCLRQCSCFEAQTQPCTSLESVPLYLPLTAARATKTEKDPMHKEQTAPSPSLLSVGVFSYWNTKYLEC